MRALAVLLLLALPALADQPNVLQWDFPVEHEVSITGFSVERKAFPCGDPAEFSQVATVGSAERTYIDRDPEPRNTYCYRVAGILPEGLTEFSNTAEKTTDPARNARPRGRVGR